MSSSKENNSSSQHYITSEKLTCPQCKSIRIFKSDKFCRDCGKKLMEMCTDCKSTMTRIGDNYCTNCGKKKPWFSAFF